MAKSTMKHMKVQWILIFYKDVPSLENCSVNSITIPNVRGDVTLRCTPELQSQNTNTRHRHKLSIKRCNNHELVKSATIWTTHNKSVKGRYVEQIGIGSRKASHALTPDHKWMVWKMYCLCGNWKPWLPFWIHSCVRWVIQTTTCKALFLAVRAPFSDVFSLITNTQN